MNHLLSFVTTMLHCKGPAKNTSSSNPPTSLLGCCEFPTDVQAEQLEEDRKHMQN